MAVWITIGPIVLGLAAASVAPNAKILFEDIVVPLGDFRLYSTTALLPEKHQIETMIAGVAVFDYNNDGLLDLYFVNGAAVPGLDKSNPR